MKWTLKQIADKSGKSPDTLARTLRRWKQAGASVPGLNADTAVGLSDVLPDELAEHLLGGTDKPADTKPDTKPKDVRAPIPKPKPAFPALPALQGADVWRSNPITAAAITVLVLADGVSAAYIAFHGYDQHYSVLAAPFFFFVGLAVGYAAVKNALDYEGYSGDTWMAALGVYQFALHGACLSLFEFLGEGTSMEIGKYALAFSIPVGAFAAVAALRSQKKAARK
jgi:hypothetical protein